MKTVVELQNYLAQFDGETHLEDLKIEEKIEHAEKEVIAPPSNVEAL